MMLWGIVWEGRVEEGEKGGKRGRGETEGDGERGRRDRKEGGEVDRGKNRRGRREGERGRGGSEERILKILLVSLQVSTLRGSSGLFPSSSSAVIGRGSFSNGFKYENK